MYNNHAMTNLMCTKQKYTCASRLVQTLEKLQVERIFGYPGASVLSIYNELSKTHNIKHYLVRHEQAAVHAAEGYARVSGKTGVVLVTSGPGFTNTITGIANAYADSTPLVILAGDVTQNNSCGKIFQNVDIISMTKSCAKKTYKLSPKDDIEEVIEWAFKEAETGIKGPVVIALPRNILESGYKESQNQNFSTNEIFEYNLDEQLEDLNQLIKNAKKPLVLVGGGAINSNIELKKFVAKLNCPIASTLMGIGIFPSTSELYLGLVGLNGTYSANTALSQCDFLIAIGASFSDRTTCKNTSFAPNAKIASININEISKSFAKDFELEIKIDINQFLNKFLEKNYAYTENTDWLKQIKTIKEENTPPEEDNSNCLHSSYVLETLSEFTKTYEPIVVTDVGQHQMLTAQFFNFNKPRKFITSGGLGTMGFGLPASIGAHIANPNNLILNITGDGSFQMNLQELATCREHNIPVKIIIMNNSYLGMVRQMQEKIYNSTYQVEMINPDFTKIAEAYDLFAIRVKTKDELIPALQKAINHSGTAIIDIVIDSFENI